MVDSYAFFKGEYATNNFRREIHVCKFCRKALVRGLNGVDFSDVREFTVKVNNKVLKLYQDYKIKEDRVYFSKPLKKKWVRRDKTYLFGLLKKKVWVQVPSSYILEICIVYNSVV